MSSTNEQLSKIAEVSRRLEEIKRMALDLREQYDVYEWKIENYVRETHESFVQKMLREWADRHAPHLPQTEVERAYKDATRSTNHGSMEQVFSHAIAQWEKDGNARQISEQQCEKDLSSLVPVGFHGSDKAAAKLRPYKYTLRVRVQFYYYGFSLYQAAPRLRLLNEVINRQLAPEVPVDLVAMVEELKEAGKLGQKWATGRKPVCYLKTYKNNKLDIWFESQEAAGKVSAVLLEAHNSIVEHWRSTY